MAAWRGLGPVRLNEINDRVRIRLRAVHRQGQARSRPKAINLRLIVSSQALAMRVAMAAIVALLVLQLVDERCNEGRYTQAAYSMLSQIVSRIG
jgi:hypothetical protein